MLGTEIGAGPAIKENTHNNLFVYKIVFFKGNKYCSKSKGYYNNVP